MQKAVGGFVAPEPTQITQAKSVTSSQAAKKTEPAADILSVSSADQTFKLNHNVRLYFDID